LSSFSFHSFKEIELKKKQNKTKQKKAAEFRGFLLYWGPYVLKDILPPAQYENFLLFSSAMSIYLSNSISPEALEFADALMLLFVKDFKIIYGLLFMNFFSILYHF